MTDSQTTIVALATPPGKGGVSVVRVSGSLSKNIAEKLLKVPVIARHAHYLPFYNLQGQLLDQGIAIFFPAPNSFTGEDVLEFQAHGGPILMDLLIENILACGATLAKPGEFSERAFHNNKIDLAQAEAIADLIECGSRQAAASALRSLSGEFSRQIKNLLEKVIYLRVYVEAAIDFPDEEVDFLADEKIVNHLQSIQTDLQNIINNAAQGSLLREGIKVVIAGKPNAGKSSLLNALAQRESAIVTEIAGTTRDILSEQIHLDGLPLHIIDTAGLRKTNNKVEQIGIQRAAQQIQNADRILLVTDAREKDTPASILKDHLPVDGDLPPVTLIKNKTDLIKQAPQIEENQSQTTIYLSAKNAQGIDLLKDHLKQTVGYQASESGVFMARRRHVHALERAQQYVENGYQQLTQMAAGEILAEELKLVQNCLNEITGEFTADDLLGEIFSSFCIGK